MQTPELTNAIASQLKAAGIKFEHSSWHHDELDSLTIPYKKDHDLRLWVGNPKRGDEMYHANVLSNMHEDNHNDIISEHGTVVNIIAKIKELLANKYESIDEQLYCECSEALTEAIETIFKQVYAAHKCVWGDISPMDDARLDNARMALAQVMADVVKQNLPKPEPANVPEQFKTFVRILERGEDGYSNAVECYELTKDIAAYYVYETTDPDCDTLFFVQHHNGKFSLVLNNRDWYTYHLSEIIAACKEYNS